MNTEQTIQYMERRKIELGIKTIKVVVIKPDNRKQEKDDSINTDN